MFVPSLRRLVHSIGIAKPSRGNVSAYATESPV